METFVMKFKVKDNNLDGIYEWSTTLTMRKSEVLETLRKEGVLIEAAFLDKSNGSWYVIYFMKCKDLKKTFSVFNASRKEIDLYHKKTLQTCLEQAEPLEVLIDFENIEGHDSGKS